MLYADWSDIIGDRLIREMRCRHRDKENKSSLQLPPNLITLSFLARYDYLSRPNPFFHLAKNAVKEGPME